MFYPWVVMMLLGTQWLYSLGLIQRDFEKLTMQFDHRGKSVLLQGLEPSIPVLQDGDQFFKSTVKKGLVLQIISYTPPLSFMP